MIRDTSERDELMLEIAKLAKRLQLLEDRVYQNELDIVSTERDVIAIVQGIPDKAD